MTWFKYRIIQYLHCHTEFLFTLWCHTHYFLPIPKTCVFNLYTCYASQNSDNDMHVRYQHMFWNRNSIRYNKYYTPVFLTTCIGPGQNVLVSARSLAAATVWSHNNSSVTKKKIAMKKKLPWQEVCVYATLWISSVSFATFKLYAQSSSARQSIDDGWYQDNTDVEWSWWKHVMSYGRNINIRT